MAEHSTLMGSLRPILRRIALSSEESAKLLAALGKLAHWEDLVLILCVGWGSVPMLQFPYSKLSKIPFRQSTMGYMAEALQQIAKVALLIYVVDVFKVTCAGIGLDFCSMSNKPHAFAQSAYSVWLAYRFKHFKKSLVRRYVSRHPDTFGRMQIINRLMDAFLYAITALLLLNIWDVQMGVALHSFLAFGSIGTLTVGLASQGIAQQVLHGLLLASSDRLYEGDSVQFSNGKSGTIVKLGWTETVLRGSDEVTVSIPNAELAKQQVSNLSRVRQCQVKQVLRFSYKDADKMKTLTEQIKEEIRLVCPDLITDGSRPFRAVWSNYGDKYLEVTVDAHFSIKPVGNAYWNNRMEVLMAIHRAAKKVEVAFA